MLIINVIRQFTSLSCNFSLPKICSSSFAKNSSLFISMLIISLFLCCNLKKLASHGYYGKK